VVHNHLARTSSQRTTLIPHQKKDSIPCHRVLRHVALDTAQRLFKMLALTLPPLMLFLLNFASIGFKGCYYPRPAWPPHARCRDGKSHSSMDSKRVDDTCAIALRQVCRSVDETKDWAGRSCRGQGSLEVAPRS
jgi:hypothetical protein